MPRVHIPFLRRSRYRRRSRLRMALLTLFVLILLVLVVPIYAIYKPPDALIDYFEHHWPDVLWRVPTDRKIVALTIDDAPSQYTKEIMDTLIANNATATFFVIGSQAQGRGETMQELVVNGNELANHAMFDEPSRSLPDVELTNQIHVVQTLIDAAYLGAKVERPSRKFFRPGSGFFSTRLRNNVAKIGYQLALGNIFPHDPQVQSADINAWHILSMARPGGIIICHDRRAWTVPMLKKVLPELKRSGYSVVTLTELLQEAGK